MEPQGFISGLKEKYDEFIAGLEEKGIPAPAIVFPLFVLVLIVGAYFLFTGALPGKLDVIVTDVSGAGIEGAQVSLSVNGESFSGGTKSTIEGGLVSFENVPRGAELKVSVSAYGYETVTGYRVTFESPGVVLEAAYAPGPVKQTGVQIQVLDTETGDYVSNAVVTFFATGDATGQSSMTAVNGMVSFTLSQLPFNARIKVEKNGYETDEQTFVQAQLSTTVFFELKPLGGTTDDPKDGDFKASVKWSSEPVEGALVTLTDANGNFVFATQTTSASGLAVFTKIAFGRKFFVDVSDPDGRYAVWNSPSALEFSADTATYQVNLEVLDAGEEDQLTVRVEDEEGKPVANAEVKAFDQASQRMMTQDRADKNGIAKLTVSDNNYYYVTVYKNGFLPSFQENAKAGDDITLTLEAEKTG
ncbi:MAG: hypothetical protein V1834_03220, partial [Candidatus Micrarchaeota archaeon]